MIITINEVRSLGFQKVWNIATRNTGTDTDLITRFKSLASLLSVCKLPPYSALKYFDAVSLLPEEASGGLCNLMKDAMPMISEVPEPDGASQRKFRYTWELLWDKFGESCNLSAYDISIIANVGLKLPVLLSAMETRNPKAMRSVKFSMSYYKALGIPESEETQRAQYQGYLLSKSDLLRKICAFYNMVIGWWLSVRNENDTSGLLTFLTVTDYVDFVSTFSQGNQLWVLEDKGFTNEELTSFLNDCIDITQKG